MANWRQIQARIRKARTGADAVEKMTALYERTRDAMAAFELGKLHEKAGSNPQAIEWYQAAADRFRREDWRARCDEAITRLGGTPAPREPGEVPRASGTDSAAASAEAAKVHGEDAGAPDSEVDEEEYPQAEAGAPQDAQPEAAASADATGAASAAAGTPDEAGRKRSRRGRRGGRRRKKPGAGSHVVVHEPPVAPPKPPPPAPSVEAPAPARAPRSYAPDSRRGDRGVERPSRAASGRGESARAPSEYGPIRLPERMEEEETQTPEREPVHRVSIASRAGDPGVASRLARLDGQLRRLIAATAHTLADSELAPAGPGVFLISDTEMTSHYYIERCATLRIAVKMALHGQRNRDGEASVKSRLADHLEISETQATKYMKDHCVVRWLQMDDGASHLAHYAIAVLQPALND